MAKPLTDIPRWISVWFILSSILVIWDFCYVFLRPRSMVGGDLHHFWSPYELYAKIDYWYSPAAFAAKEGFSGAQSFLNVIETILNAEFVYLANFTKGKLKAGAVLVGFTAAVMTLSKTVLYWAIEYYSDYSSIGHNTLQDLILLWIIPNGLWVVVPAIIVNDLGTRIWEALVRDSEAAVGKKLL